LKLKKCLYYIMFWDFDEEGRASLRSANEIPPLLLTNGRDAAAKPITQYDYTRAHKYLGLRNSPSLSMRDNRAALQQASNNFGKRIFKSGLTKSEVWLAYFTCYIPSITFTFPVASFTKQDLGNRAVSGIVEGVHDFFSKGGMTVIVTGPTENLETFSLGGRFRPSLVHFSRRVDDIKTFFYKFCWFECDYFPLCSIYNSY
jgi:hypothetical protein